MYKIKKGTTYRILKEFYSQGVVNTETFSTSQQRLLKQKKKWVDSVTFSYKNLDEVFYNNDFLCSIVIFATMTASAVFL